MSKSKILLASALVFLLLCLFLAVLLEQNHAKRTDKPLIGATCLNYVADKENVVQLEMKRHGLPRDWAILFVCAESGPDGLGSGVKVLDAFAESQGPEAVAKRSAEKKKALQDADKALSAAGVPTSSHPYFIRFETIDSLKNSAQSTPAARCMNAIVRGTYVRPSSTDGSSYSLDEKDVSEIRNELDVLLKELEAARSMSFDSEHKAEQYYSKIYRHYQRWNEILSRPEYEGMNRLCEFNEEFQRKVDAIDDQSKKYMEEVAARRETEKEDPGSYSRTIDNLVRKGILKEVDWDAENRRVTVVIGDPYYQLSCNAAGSMLSKISTHYWIMVGTDKNLSLLLRYGTRSGQVVAPPDVNNAACSSP